MKPCLPILLSLNGGYVDTAGFLALQGLFAAHVTGNFVTLGAALVFGTSGVLAKLLALPVFCIVVTVTRLVGQGLAARGLRVLPTMLAVKVALLVAGGLMAIRLGPFSDGDGWPAIAIGMTLVAAMAIQNVAHRAHLGTAPPTTLMTGTTTQIMLDVADLMYGAKPGTRDLVRARLRRMALSVGAFAVGCGAAALMFTAVSVWCFVIPPVIGFATLLLRPGEFEATGSRAT